MVLDRLRAGDGRMELRRLADDIAGAESGESPPPRRVRDSVYVSLHQTHLPKLDDAGAIEYDEDRKTVALARAAGQLDAYRNVVTEYGFTWETYYRIVATVALTGIVLAEIAVPSLGTLALATLFLFFIFVSGVYRIQH